MQLRVLLLERSPLIRDGFRRILEEEPDITVVAGVANAADAVVALSEHGADVVVVGGTLERDALRASEIIALRRAGDGKILCVGHWADSRDLDGVLGAGALGCVEVLNATDADLKMAVCLVGRGEPYLSPGLSRAAALGASTWEPDSDRLTAREKEVLVLIAHGKSNREIARELNLSANTIAVHRNHMMKKIGVRKATALALFAAERGLLVRK